jgi:hypothetical protein
MWDVPETESKDLPSEDKAHLESSVKSPMRVRRGLCVNIAKRLKMDAKKGDSVSEKVKAEAEKRCNDDAEPKERGLLEK